VKLNYVKFCPVFSVICPLELIKNGSGKILESYKVFSFKPTSLNVLFQHYQDFNESNEIAHDFCTNFFFKFFSIM
jgi:hypothetical protein